MAAIKIRHDQFFEVTQNFLGSNWSFYVCLDGKAYWIHKSGKVLPSSRNWSKNGKASHQEHGIHNKVV